MSKTLENLKEAFAGESQARNKYQFFAKRAKKEGFNYVAKVFEEAAENEKQHAKELFKLIVRKKTSTVDNLKTAIEGEGYEHEEMYPKFAKQASEEGDEKAAKLFAELAKVELAHKERFQKMLEIVKSGKVYKRDEVIAWKCSECGHIHFGLEPPEACPLCDHEKKYFVPQDDTLIERKK